ncbi:hypothetical protein BDZ94DRAFT_439139 [Collybia nuda]|uniref:Uncharacterized protein n=1 Tax=Collybia nuda TaxID=64659 RepID=A0A9P5XUW7_9AGAR|nr:hypothetical protein BDZ94DRAFT_439139 [Collybia nuda]
MLILLSFLTINSIYKTPVRRQSYVGSYPKAVPRSCWTCVHIVDADTFTWTTHAHSLLYYDTLCLLYSHWPLVYVTFSGVSLYKYYLCTLLTLVQSTIFYIIFLSNTFLLCIPVHTITHYVIYSTNSIDPSYLCLLICTLLTHYCLLFAYSSLTHSPYLYIYP